MKSLFDSGMGCEDAGAPLGVSRPRKVRYTRPNSTCRAAHTNFKIAYSEQDDKEFRPRVRMTNLFELPAYLTNKLEKQHFSDPMSGHPISKKIEPSNLVNSQIQ